MKWKLVSAFASGAVLAAGIVYFSVKPDVPPNVPPPVPATAAIPQRVAVPAPVEAAPTPVTLPAPAVAQAPQPVHEKLSPKPVREKPSPMPPPVRRADPIRIARNDLPVSAAPRIDPAPIVVAPVQPTPPPVPTSQPAVPVENVSLPAPAPAPARAPNTVTLSPGALVAVRIGETLSSAHNQPGDTFLATLTQPLVVDGWVIAERGARVEGRIVDAAQAGRVKGASRLGISIVRISLSDGQKIRVRTEPFVKDAASSTGTDAAKIGGGAALGAIIGAITGGGKGAAIGAGAGGAIGAGDVLLTRGKPAEIPVETRVSFKVQDPVTITERVE